MIEAIDLTVRRRGRTVLDAVSFDVRPGQVTGVLGGTGAGKTMLLRRMVELERGRGKTLFDGRPYRALPHPMREVGLLLDPARGDSGRTVRGHLRLMLAADRGAAREGTLVGVRRVSGEAVTAERRTPGDGVAGNPHPFVGRGGALRSGATVPAAAPGGRVTRAADAGLDDRSAKADDHLDGMGELDCGSGGGDADGCGHDGDPACDRSHDRGRRHLLGRRRDGAHHGALRHSGLSPDDLAGRIEATRRGRAGDRIDAVLDVVGLSEHGRTRLADLTEGMTTRLGIAATLLGDPRALLLDCPDRGLEPEGVAWLGALLRAFTAQGRAALVTGSDTETLVAMVDRVLLLDSGYLVGTRTSEEVLRAPTGASVVVRSPQIVRFAAILAEAGARSTQGEGACLEVRGLDRARVGDLAYRHGIPVHELADHFTGSDPADLVLAACAGRRIRPVVPIQGLADGARAAGRPGAAGSLFGTTAAPARAARVGVPVRAGLAEPTGSARLITVPPDSAASTGARQAAKPVARPGAAAGHVPPDEAPSAPPPASISSQANAPSAMRTNLSEATEQSGAALSEEPPAPVGSADERAAAPDGRPTASEFAAASGTALPEQPSFEPHTGPLPEPLPEPVNERGVQSAVDAIAGTTQSTGAPIDSESVAGSESAVGGTGFDAGEPVADAAEVGEAH